MGPLQTDRQGVRAIQVPVSGLELWPSVPALAYLSRTSSQSTELGALEAEGRGTYLPVARHLPGRLGQLRPGRHDGCFLFGHYPFACGPGCLHRRNGSYCSCSPPPVVHADHALTSARRPPNRPIEAHASQLRVFVQVPRLCDPSPPRP
jgi:hypothetical protein